ACECANPSVKSDEPLWSSAARQGATPTARSISMNPASTITSHTSGRTRSVNGAYRAKTRSRASYGGPHMRAAAGNTLRIPTKTTRVSGDTTARGSTNVRTADSTTSATSTIPPTNASTSAAIPTPHSIADGASPRAFLRESVARARHVLGPDPTVEVVRGDEAEIERSLLELEPVLVRVLGDLRRAVVADVCVERSHEHERVLDVLGDPLLVRFETVDAELAEVSAGVGEQVDGVQEVEDHHRLEDVEL